MSSTDLNLKNKENDYTELDLSTDTDFLSPRTKLKGILLPYIK